MPMSENQDEWENKRKEDESKELSPQVDKQDKANPNQNIVQPFISTPVAHSRRKIDEESEVSVASEDKNSTQRAQKIAQIIKESEIFEYDDVYCICCTPTQDGVSYIGCESWDDWFHFEWIGLDPHTNINSNQREIKKSGNIALFIP